MGFWLQTILDVVSAYCLSTGMVSNSVGGAIFCESLWFAYPICCYCYMARMSNWKIASVLSVAFVTWLGFPAVWAGCCLSTLLSFVVITFFFFFFFERDSVCMPAGEGQRERENLKWAAGSARSPAQGSISQP